jgi:PAS domain S-box-containing protein
VPALHALVFPLLVWAALRFGVDGAAWALLEVVCVAVWCDMRGHGAFIPSGNGAAAYALAEQAFLSMAAVATLTLAAALAERRWAMERFRRLVESAPNGIVMVDASDRITFANLRAQHMFGYKQEELVGQRVDILVPPVSRDAYASMRSQFLNDPVEAPIGSGRDLLAQRKDGSLLSVEIGLNPVRTQEGPMVLASLLDISERKLAEERLRAAYLEKEVLLKEVYHRVKNNLQIASALISLQSRHVSEQAARDALARGEARIHSMALVHEQLYRSENLSTLDVGSYLGTLVGYLRTQFNEPLRIQVECDAIHLGMDQAIPCGLIVTELVTNASRHAFVDGRCGEVVVGHSRSNPT